MDFKFIDKKYRPIPFWSWNEKLDTEETKRQVALMDEAGIGGYFMHARGGLLTEYMGEEWFDNVKAAIEEGDKRGMHSWAYDENGWPSGFGGGKVNGLGLDYQQKNLLREPLKESGENAERTVAVIDGFRYYYNVNPYYVDVLDPKVTKKFIDVIYDEYHKRCPGEFDGFFTDEPQILRGEGYPWSFILPEEFSKRYGYSLVDNLDALFTDKENSERVRVDYWLLVTEMFSENFFKQIYDYCTSHGYELTGHLVCEDTMDSQLLSNGAAMPHYEYFTVPGMDWLGRPIPDRLTGVQLGSVAAQTGKKQVLSETFALAGHNVSHEELKRIYEWQMVRGINLLCTHLEGYTLRGIRKRDYPPAMYYQQPWWNDMKLFFDSVSRIGMLLSEGEVEADTLLLHPQTTAWILYDGAPRASYPKINEYDKKLLGVMRALESKHVLYHLGDEILIRRHGKVENGYFVIGNMKYKRVVIPEHLAFLPYTEELLSEFVRQGGKIVKPDDIPASDVTDVNSLTYTKRVFPDFDLHYFVNTSYETVTAKINVGNKQLVVETGDTVAFFGEHTFGPNESLVVIDTHEPRESKPIQKATEKLSLDGEWTVKGATLNSITLDRCDYSFDDGDVEKNVYVLDILPRANEKRRPVRLKQTYRFTCEGCVPKTLYLVTETPDLFDITVNGKTIEKKDEGYFRDSSFRMIPISEYATVGENTVVFNSTVTQREETYKHLDDSWTFEAMKNCLSYDVEIEPIYIAGDFSAEIKGDVEELDRDAYRIKEPPVIAPARKTVDINRLDMSGYPEFSGELTLTKSFRLDGTDHHVTLVGRGINCIHLTVNGKYVTKKLFGPYDVDISDHLVKGENTLELKIVNNLRNMQGPFHMKEGECFGVGPRAFFRESNVFSHPAGAGESCHDVLPWWHDDICLVHYGVK